MPDPLDLGPATGLTASVVAAVPDGALDRPTPCPEYRVRDLLAHLDGLSMAFTAAAGKDLGPLTEDPGDGELTLEDGWRERIPSRLAALADAWRDASAWTGMTRAGGVDLPGEVAGLVALDEVVLHGWDLAVATGRSYDPDEAATAAVLDFLTESRQGEVPESLFGPVVDVAGDARPFDRALGLAGRDPAWRP